MNVAALSLGLLAAVGSLRADEKTIKLGDLPKAVRSALKAKFPEGKLTGVSKEDEGGKEIYEVSLKDEGAEIDVAVSAKGKILEVEKTIDAETLPKAVATAIKAKYPKAKIKKVEEVVTYEEGDDDEEKFFEVDLSTDGKHDAELKISPKGKILDDGEEEDEDEAVKEEKKEKKDKDES